MLFIKKRIAEPKKPLGLYIHIPFCVKKCNYCDFLSGTADDAAKSRYVNALCREIEGYKQLTGGHRLATIYFGGGTPSLLDVSFIEQILNAVRSCFEVEGEAEVTLEVNPGTVSLDKLKRYKELGINRLSIGVQSAKEKELALLGRIHTFEDAKQTVLWARQTGFGNISLDIMSALPNQSFEDYKENLEEILLLNPEHISSYSLIVEEGTTFYGQYAEGAPKEAELPDEETDREMYAYTQERLAQAGYKRYEISNYAKPGFESRHNSSYWLGTEYLGVGLGASSLFSNTRYHNETDLHIYAEEAEAGLDVRREIEPLGPEEQMEEFMFLGLRMMQGVSREAFQKRFGTPIETVYQSALKKLERQGLLTMKGDSIALTETGINVSNQVFVEFISE